MHPAVQIPGERSDVLPAYVPREHDAQLREVVGQLLAEGSSRLITLVGGSSTGKTRACWELAGYLDGRDPGRWWLWHPYDPSRPDAALADLDRVGSYTIVWLNEAQFYLALPDAGLAERVAAALRSLLHDPQRGPVLVLATMWPKYWDELVVRPETGRPDRYAQARELLAGSRVSVADQFTPSELAGLQTAGVDARLRQAAAHAEGGRITQYLAGAPDLEDRYRTAPPAARALLQVAIDARRLGYPPALPHALLAQAAPGYLDDHDWDALDEDWLENALAYTARPCKGARGALSRIRPRPGGPAPPGGQPCYRLADYLEQIGGRERAGAYPPDSFWFAAAVTVADPGLLRRLGEQAWVRGRYQHAIWLYTQAADHGEPRALEALAWLRKRAGDAAGVDVVYRRAADHGNGYTPGNLARLWELLGDIATAEDLYRQAADRGDVDALRDLVRLRERAGDAGDAEAVAFQAADRGVFDGLEALAWMREQAGDAAGAEALYRQAADRGDVHALGALAGLRERAGDPAGAEALYRQAADRGDVDALRELAYLLEEAGDPAAAEALYRQAADRGDVDALRELAYLLEEAGDCDGAEAVAFQATDRGDVYALRALAGLRERAGDPAGAEALYRQAADRGDVTALRDLVRLRERAGNAAGAEAVAFQAADRGDVEALGALARLREQAGDAAGAEALYRQAADLGDISALWGAATLREHAGDIAAAEALYRRVANRGDNPSLLTLIEAREKDGNTALSALANLRERAGDARGAGRIRRFGLTGKGDPATTLDFGSYGGLVPDH